MSHKQAVGLKTLLCLFETSLAVQSGLKPRRSRTGDPFALASVVQETCATWLATFFLWPFIKMIVSAIIVSCFFFPKTGSLCVALAILELDM